MKYIINDCFGGFGIKKNILKTFDLDSMCFDELRTNEHLITCIENGEDINTSCSNLAIVNIPDEASDWQIHEYDGYESIIYVIDGKIYWLYA